MSRLTFPIKSICQHVELNEFYSQSRGELRVTYVCHHPDRDGCLCVLNGASVAECKHCQEDEEVKTVHA